MWQNVLYDNFMFILIVSAITVSLLYLNMKYEYPISHKEPREISDADVVKEILSSHRNFAFGLYFAGISGVLTSAPKVFDIYSKSKASFPIEFIFLIGGFALLCLGFLYSMGLWKWVARLEEIKANKKD